ncbi:MAG: nicotinate (nicotinamide) nucleotide adenylyltransferase [Treponema sp.]|nr:nicotinate (nicotinamide) nucleotide adenylyltransferase [Treponema sp.]
MRIAVFGGSFNPVHVGHLFLADAVLSNLGYDRVVLVPAYRSPFKLAVLGMEDSTRSRLEMIAASIAGDPRLTIDDCEIRRGGVSFTVDTLADIIRRYAPDGKPGLIIGDDLAGDFPDWRRSDEILSMADVIVARRIRTGELRVPFPCVQVANEVMEVSSGMVRERIAANGPWRYLVPAAARTIIEGRGLYGCPQAPEADGFTGTWPGGRPSKNILVRVEEAARESLSFDRFLHSRNTALLARDLCLRFSLNPALGYLAGIAHDLAKPLSDRAQIRLAKSDGREISPFEKEKPSMLHGRASAVLLKEHFGVHNESVLEAISAHTSGSANMGPLAKVVYIADKMEVSREKVDPALRKLVFAGDDLDEIFVMVLERVVSSLRSGKLRLSEETQRLLEKLGIPGAKTHGRKHKGKET